MAGRGFAPSGRAQKASRNARRDVVKSDGKLAGYPLPADVLGTDKDGEPIQWHSRTVAWWEAWRASPQSVRMMTEPDWSFLLDTALIHHFMWAGGRWEFAAEVRLRVSKFGATPEDRARLKIEIEATPDAPQTVVTDAAMNRANARRDRVMGELDRGNVTPINPNQ